MPQLSRQMWIRARACENSGHVGLFLGSTKRPSSAQLGLGMCLRITPLAGGLKAAQYAVMREMKLSLDQVLHPAASTMLAFGVIGTGFQSVIYNTLISEMYKIYTGKAQCVL